MEVKAKLRHLRIAPRKVRLVAHLIKGLPVKQAEAQLEFANKISCTHILRLLHSAMANATNNYSLLVDSLIVKNVLVNEGYTLKRSMPRAHGRATVIRKRSSHVTLTLEGKPADDSKKKTVKKEAVKEEKELKNKETVTKK
ncbi:MAG: 50S ribosomal protein L22 [Patescibacteria group bacterium]